VPIALLGTPASLTLGAANMGGQLSAAPLDPPAETPAESASG